MRHHIDGPHQWLFLSDNDLHLTCLRKYFDTVLLDLDRLKILRSAPVLSSYAERKREIMKAKSSIDTLGVSCIIFFCSLSLLYSHCTRTRLFTAIIVVGPYCLYAWFSVMEMVTMTSGQCGSLAHRSMSLTEHSPPIMHEQRDHHGRAMSQLRLFLVLLFLRLGIDRMNRAALW